MGRNLPHKQKKWLADSALSILSLLPLPYVHEMGHIIMAFVFDVAVVDTFLIPQVRGNRIGIGISVDWRTASSPAVMVLVLLGGFLITSMIGLLLYHSQNITLKRIGLVWLMGSPLACGYDFVDIGVVLGSPFSGYFVKYLGYVVSFGLLRDYYTLLRSSLTTSHHRNSEQ
jgi:hypothetical protein